MVRPAPLSQRIDDFLDYLTGEWERVPSLAREWPEWSEHDRLVLDVEWAIREDRMAELLRYREQGRLSRPQEKRLALLLELVRRHRPIVESLVGPTAQAERTGHPA